MLDDNYVQEENPILIQCVNCKNWYHPKCTLLSDNEYEEIKDNDATWFCEEFYCQQRKNECAMKQNIRKDRSHLSRICKKKDIDPIEYIDDIEENLQTTINTNENEIFVPCLICKDKKLYKKKGGLKIHCTRKHANEDVDFMFTQEKEKDPGSDPIEGENFESILLHSKNNIRVLRRIPKGARFLAATKLSEAIENCISKNAERKLARFNAFCLQRSSST